MIGTSLSLFHDKRISNCTSIYCITQISINALKVIWKNVVTMRCVVTLQALIVVYVTLFILSSQMMMSVSIKEEGITVMRTLSVQIQQDHLLVNVTQVILVTELPVRVRPQK